MAGCDWPDVIDHVIIACNMADVQEEEACKVLRKAGEFHMKDPKLEDPMSKTREEAPSPQEEFLTPLKMCLPILKDVSPCQNGVANANCLNVIADGLELLSVNATGGQMLREVEEGKVSPPFKSRQSRSPLRAHRRLNATPRKPTPSDSNKDTKLAGGIKTRNRYRSRSLSASSTDSYSSAAGPVSF